MNAFKFNSFSSSELSAKDLSRLTNIFSSKRWPITNPFGDSEFDNFCKMLSGLDQEQRDLILSLTKKFLWVQDFSYLSCFSKVFDNFISAFSYNRKKKIIICPLLPEEDFGKVKSSCNLLYMIKANIIHIQNKYTDYSISYVDSPDRVNLQLIKSGFTLCLIDDYIGTGETVERATQYFIDRNIVKEEMVILSLVGMREGIDKLTNYGFSVFTDYICEKGLTGVCSQKDIEIMNNIEDKIEIDERYKMGYMHSEALVKVMRTPNNTFPIYWYTSKKNKFAPFPR